MRARPTLAAALLLLAAPAAAQPAQPVQPAQPLYKFALDYAVPESPGFAVLGVTPEKVLRGNAAKPVLATLLNQIASGGQVKNGVALDVVPYFVYGGTVRNATDYRRWYKRALANAQLSFATMQSQADTTSSAFGAGVRVSFLDPHDVLGHPELLAAVDDSLIACSRTGAAGGGPPRPGQLGGSGDVTRKKCPGVAVAFAAAKEAARARTGFALAVGGGFGGRLRSGVASGDSLTDRVSRVWVAGGYTLGRTQEIQFLAQAKDTVGRGWKARGGLALRAKLPSAQLALEGVYDGDARQLQPGGAVEWRVIPGVWVVTSLGSETVEVDGAATSKLRLRTALRWNPTAREQ